MPHRPRALHVKSVQPESQSIIHTRKYMHSLSYRMKLGNRLIQYVVYLARLQLHSNDVAFSLMKKLDGDTDTHDESLLT